jgi:eukaryotic-like serine/threonine-protein kinase
VSEYVLDSRYELVERIAAGGMGEVWLGNDQILGRPVAIKLLHANHAGDEQFRARFRAEARYAGSLSHPGIARVYDYGEHSPLGGPYLVMELVNGEPLSAILERVGRLPPDTVLDIVSQAARALDVAHQAGIVHRDIKPGNLLIMADGTTKITDFGIAKARSEREANLTATGIVMGTAMYVSPEQATGSTVTGSSDIYSLGVVAYECLAGQPPFMAEQPLAIAIMHKHDPVPPLPHDIPWQVGDLVMSMLAKTPDGRPETARHVADRADIIRDARTTSGAGYATTANLPVVPDFPPPDYPTRLDGTYQGDYQDPYPERAQPSLLARHRLAAAGVGVAVCGVGAIAAVLLSSGGNQPTQVGDTHSPKASASASKHPAKASARATQTSSGAASTTLETAPPETTPAQPVQQPTTFQPSPTAAPSTAPPTTAPPTAASPPTTTSPSAPASNPATAPASPTASASIPIIGTEPSKG